MPTIHDIIERAGLRGLEMSRISRPVDTGQVSAAITRPESFVDPTLDPDTGLPVETDYWRAGDAVGSKPVSPK